MSETPTPPWPRRRLLSVMVGVAVGVVVLAAIVTYVALRSSGPDQTAGARATPSASATPLDAEDLSGLPVSRGSLCNRIERSDVETALGGTVTRTTRYDSGDRTAIAPGVRDVAHEYDCTYRASSGAEARIWVFAEPVTRPEAAGIARDARTTKHCRPVTGGPTYGTPDVATSCHTGPDRAVTLAGLFGDAWLSCRVSTPAAGGPDSAQVGRTQRWCVQVATSVGARP